MASPRIRRVVKPDPEPKLYLGRVNESAATGHDLITAAIPALFDGEEFVTAPLPFDRRADGVLPAKGDACLVGIDDQGGEWFMKYEPASGIAHAEEH